jgi:hypothetical protein
LVPAENRGAKLAKVAAMMVEDIEDGRRKVSIDNWFLLALVQFALRHGAVTLADLEKPDEVRVTS